MNGPRGSKRFDPSFWSKILVPVILFVLVLGLLATLVITGLALVGLTPGS